MPLNNDVNRLPNDLIFDVYGGAGAVQSLYNVSAAATTAAGFRVVRSAGYLKNTTVRNSRALMGYYRYPPLLESASKRPPC